MKPCTSRMFAVVTTRNEHASIYSLVNELRASGYVSRVVVVDAASTDGTPDLAEKAGALVLREPRIPIAPALMKGWCAALEAGALGIVQLDAGFSHSAWDVPRLVNGLRQADFVVGSRFLPDSKYVGGRRVRSFFSRMAALACNATWGYHVVSDWTSGFRAMTAPVATMLLSHSYQAKMHGWQIEVLINVLRNSHKVTEVPITYQAGRSSMNSRIALEAVRAWSDMLVKP